MKDGVNAFVLVLLMTPMIRSLVLMSAGIALMTANDAVSKYLVQSHPVGQVICLRQVATLLVLIPYIMYFSSWSVLRVTNLSGQIARGALFLIGSGFIVWSLSKLPLATAVTMLFVSPIFMVMLSVPLLGEPPLDRGTRRLRRCADHHAARHRLLPVGVVAAGCRRDDQCAA